MSAIIVKQDLYDPRKLDAIYHNIISKNNTGKKQLYEIKVDDFPVVGKNSNPERFMDYAKYVSSENRFISVLLFKDNGQSDKYFFYLQPDSYQKAEHSREVEVIKPNPLYEIELAERIQKDARYEELLKENTMLNKIISEYEVVFEKMLEEMEQVKSNWDIKAEAITNIFYSFIQASMKCNTNTEEKLK